MRALPVDFVAVRDILLLFIMCPHPDNFNGFGVFEDLIDEPVLNVNPTGISSLKISDQLLIGRRVLKGIMLKDGK